MMRALHHLRFEDVAGCLALFLLLFGAFWVGSGLGLPTGADQLMAAP